MFSAAEQWNHNFLQTCTQAWSKQGLSKAHHHMAEQNLLHLFALSTGAPALSECQLEMLCLTVFSFVMLRRVGFCLWKQLLLFLVTVMMLQ